TFPLEPSATHWWSTSPTTGWMRRQGRPRGVRPGGRGEGRPMRGSAKSARVVATLQRGLLKSGGKQALHHSRLRSRTAERRLLAFPGLRTRPRHSGVLVGGLAAGEGHRSRGGREDEQDEVAKVSHGGLGKVGSGARRGVARPDVAGA